VEFAKSTVPVTSAGVYSATSQSFMAIGEGVKTCANSEMSLLSAIYYKMCETVENFLFRIIIRKYLIIRENDF